MMVTIAAKQTEKITTGALCQATNSIWLNTSIGRNGGVTVATTALIKNRRKSSDAFTFPLPTSRQLQESVAEKTGEPIRDNNTDHGGHRRHHHGATDAFRASRRRVAFVGANRRQHERKHETFKEAVADRVEIHQRRNVANVFFRIDAGEESAHEGAAEDRHEKTGGQQKEARDDNADKSRQDDFLNRIGAEAANGVDLFRHLHGAEFGRRERADLPAQQKCDKKRADFANRGACGESAEVAESAECVDLHRELNRHDRADKKSGERGRRQALNRDFPDLIGDALRNGKACETRFESHIAEKHDGNRQFLQRDD